MYDIPRISSGCLWDDGASWAVANIIPVDYMAIQPATMYLMRLPLNGPPHIKTSMAMSSATDPKVKSIAYHPTSKRE